MVGFINYMPALGVLRGKTLWIISDYTWQLSVATECTQMNSIRVMVLIKRLTVKLLCLVLSFYDVRVVVGVVNLQEPDNEPRA